MANVIVVEDEPGLGRGLRDALATAGHHAEWVPNAEQGIKWIREHRPDLVILDVRLPGMTGLDLLTELADDPDRPASIVITAYGDIEEIDLDGEYIVDNGHAVAWDASLRYTLTRARQIRSFLFSDQLLMRFSGRGKLWVQSRNPRSLANWVVPFRPVQRERRR